MLLGKESEQYYRRMVGWSLTWAIHWGWLNRTGLLVLGRCSPSLSHFVGGDVPSWSPLHFPDIPTQPTLPPWATHPDSRAAKMDGEARWLRLRDNLQARNSERCSRCAPMSCRQPLFTCHLYSTYWFLGGAQTHDYYRPVPTQNLLASRHESWKAIHQVQQHDLLHQ